MAIIKCSECGKEISDKAKKCIHCGYKIKRNNKNNKAIKIVIILVILLVIALVGMGIYVKVVVPANRYKNAEELLNNEKYTEARVIFEELGDYEDSQSKIVFIDEKLVEIEEERKLASKKNNLKYAFATCTSDGAKLSSDGMSIIINSKNKNDSEALIDVMLLIDKLGLPDSLFEDMTMTNALMGKQSEEYENYVVEWSYHPDNGLDVIFKIKE